jgi:hypothetical protein
MIMSTEDYNKVIAEIKGWDVTFYKRSSKAVMDKETCEVRDWLHNIADAWELFEENKWNDRFINYIIQVVFEKYWEDGPRYEHWKYLSAKNVIQYLDSESICKAYILYKDYMNKKIKRGKPESKRIRP